MSSFLFYDPNPNSQHQQSQLDPDIPFIHRLDILKQSIEDNIHLKLAVCVCCNDTSGIIESIKDYPQVACIYPCEEHGGQEANPLFDPKVRDSTMFTPDSGWEFKVRLALLQECIRHHYDEQFLNERQKLTDIKKRSQLISS